jgi:hypothetical protein
MARVIEYIKDLNYPEKTEGQTETVLDRQAYRLKIQARGYLKFFS